MFARVIRMHGQPNKLQDGIHAWEERIHIVESLKGFQNVYLLTDQKSGMVMAISLWATEEDVNASNSAIIPIRDAVSTAIGASGPPIQEVYRVSGERGRMMRKAA